MARARTNLAEAVNEILERHGNGGRKLSLRQAERLTGLAPATIGELAKGNARTAESVRRFAVGMGEDVTRLLLLAGFVPDELLPSAAPNAISPSNPATALSPAPIDPEIQQWADRLGRAIARLPPGRERELWKTRLRCETELLEMFLLRQTHSADADSP